MMFTEELQILTIWRLVLLLKTFTPDSPYDMKQLAYGQVVVTVLGDRVKEIRQNACAGDK